MVIRTRYNNAYGLHNKFCRFFILFICPAKSKKIKSGRALYAIVFFSVKIVSEDSVNPSNFSLLKNSFTAPPPLSAASAIVILDSNIFLNIELRNFSKCLLIDVIAYIEKGLALMSAEIFVAAELFISQIIKEVSSSI